jgi:putative nucleotidyltransferase with HDIG domain
MKMSSSLRTRLFPRLFLVLGGIGAFACVVTGTSAIWLHGSVLGLLVGLALSLALADGTSLLVVNQLEAQNQIQLATICGGTAQRQNLEQLSQSLVFADAAAAWAKAVRNLEETNFRLQTNAQRTSSAFDDFMRMMAKAIDERTSYLRGHSERVANYSAEIARELQLPASEVEQIRLAGLLHDIGTIGVEDSIIMKSAPLTPEEFDIVKSHTVKGAAILRPIEHLSDVIPGVELHHESLDGRGYPYGLHGDEIPMMARVIAVADSFDAMTSPRPYQAAMEPQYVLEVLKRLAGTRHDGRVVDALARLVQGGSIVVKNHRPPSRVRREQASVS